MFWFLEGLGCRGIGVRVVGPWVSEVVTSGWDCWDCPPPGEVAREHLHGPVRLGERLRWDECCRWSDVLLGSLPGPLATAHLHHPKVS